MFDLLKEKTESSFEKIEQKLKSIIEIKVSKWMRDPSLRVIEDSDSLYNIAMLKVYEAFKNFKYDESISERYNELRFYKMIHEYVRNMMIDCQYSANARKRKPKFGIIISIQSHLDDDDDSFNSESILPESNQYPNPHQSAYLNEIKEKMRKILNPDEYKIFDMLSQGYTHESVAGILGILTSRVRHTLYSKIQPAISEFMKWKKPV